MINSGLFTPARDNWGTPQDFFDELDKEFHFDLDPCADEYNHKCDRYFTRDDNGLQKDWSGSAVFCNPPYGTALPKWVKKCYEESRKPGTTVVMLIPARTDSKVFHDYIYGHAEIRFIRGRLRFQGAKWNAPFPSMVVVFRSGNETAERDAEAENR